MWYVSIFFSYLIYWLPSWHRSLNVILVFLDISEDALKASSGRTWTFRAVTFLHAEIQNQSYFSLCVKLWCNEVKCGELGDRPLIDVILVISDLTTCPHQPLILTSYRHLEPSLIDIFSCHLMSFWLSLEQKSGSQHCNFIVASNYC